MFETSKTLKTWGEWEHGDPRSRGVPSLMLRAYRSLRKRHPVRSRLPDAFVTTDQTTQMGALAQIECIVQKTSPAAAAA